MEDLYFTELSKEKKKKKKRKKKRAYLECLSAQEVESSLLLRHPLRDIRDGVCNSQL